MDTVVVSAFVTALSSILIALFAAGWSWRQARDVEQLRHRLDLEGRKQERSWTAQEVLKRYRKPLLEAAEQLGRRLDNIQRGNFLAYVAGGKTRHEITILSTLFRLARSFGTLEIIDSEEHFLEFAQPAETKRVTDTLEQIGKTFASDRLDGTRFMIWREEQRGIGELSITRDPAGVLRCVGFATFASRFPLSNLRFLASFAADLQSDGAMTSERLTQLRRQLAHLVRELDEEKRFSGRSNWIDVALSVGEDAYAGETTW